jgi:hypothetical protein
VTDFQMFEDFVYSQRDGKCLGAIVTNFIVEKIDKLDTGIDL